MKNLQYIKDKILKLTEKVNSIYANKKLISYLVFVGIATVLWFLNALSKDYTTKISFPVNYKNIPEDKVLINDLPEKLFLEIKGGGFAILRYKISTAFQPVNFDVKHKISRKNSLDKKLHFTINTNSPDYINSISNDLSSDIELLKIIPDTIGFHFADIINKKVAVKANTKISYANQFALRGDISVTPDSVIISGPSNILDTIQALYTSVIEFENLDRCIKRNTSLKKPENVNCSRNRIVVNIPVDRYTEATKYVKITAVNTPDSVQLKLFPAKIKVDYRVSLSDFQNIGENDFNVSVNYADITNQSSFLKIKLENYPKEIKNIKIYPSLVEFIIEKNAK